MNRLLTLSLAMGAVGYSTIVCANVSQFPCDKIIYENVIEHTERRLRVCLSDKNVTFTLDPRMDGSEKIDIRVPVDSVTFTQIDTASGMSSNSLIIHLNEMVGYTINNSIKNLRLLVMNDNDIFRSYRLSSPTADDISGSLVKYGIRLDKTPH